MNAQVHEVNYAIFPQVWKPVYEQPSEQSKIIGYTKRSPGQLSGIEVWGSEYKNNSNSLFGRDELNNPYNTWIGDSFALWEKQPCSLSN